MTDQPKDYRIAKVATTSLGLDDLGPRELRGLADWLDQYQSCEYSIRYSDYYDADSEYGSSGIRVTVSKTVYEGDPEYQAIIVEERAQEVEQKARAAKHREAAERAAMFADDKSYYDYLHNRPAAMKEMEAKYGPCPRWIGYTPKYTEEECGYVRP